MKVFVGLSIIVNNTAEDKIKNILIKSANAIIFKLKNLTDNKVSCVDKISSSDHNVNRAPFPTCKRAHRRL